MTELHNSHLGDKDYWDNTYITELDNFRNNQDDVGEIWFGEKTEQRIVEWLTEHVKPGQPIADIGTGNGHLLRLLADEGFSCLTGMWIKLLLQAISFDYSESSIALARAVNTDFPEIQFRCRNVLNWEKPDQYHLCLDKGTYDAISLSTTSASDRVIYKHKIHEMVGEAGLFLLASVNWTIVELQDFYSDLFDMEEVLPCKKFTFGGVTGQDVAIIVLRPIRTAC